MGGIGSTVILDKKLSNAVFVESTLELINVRSFVVDSFWMLFWAGGGQVAVSYGRRLDCGNANWWSSGRGSWGPLVGLSLFSYCLSGLLIDGSI